MTIVLQKKHLIKALSNLDSIVEKTTALPILSMVLMEIKTNESDLKMTASDMEVQVQTLCQTVPCNSDYCLCIPEKKLLAIVREFPEDEDITIEEDRENRRALIHCGNSKYALPGEDPAQFPKLQDPFCPDTSIPPDAFRQMTTHVESCMATGAEANIKINLSGVLFDIEYAENDAIITAVCTDGKRLALSRIPADRDINIAKVIIPRKAIQAAKRVAAESVSDKFRVLFTDYLAVFSNGVTTLKAKTIGADFPDYKRLLGHKYELEAFINGEDLAGALRRAAVVIKENASPSVNIALYDNTMAITGGTESESAIEHIRISYTGEQSEARLNYRYLLDAANAYNRQPLRMQFNNAENPFCISPESGTDALTIIMPMR